MPKVTSRDLMIATWRGLGGPRVGAKELRRIQRVLEKEFGEDGLQSPAAIARVVADEGAELAHPEIIEFDARWREAQIKQRTNRFESLDPMVSSELLSLAQAEVLITRLEQLRLQFTQENAADALGQLTTVASQTRENAESNSHQRTADPTTKIEQAEIAEWLKIWIQTPSLFADWVELRKRSTEFKRKFEQNSN
jgi:hypothetical protein